MHLLLQALPHREGRTAVGQGCRGRRRGVPAVLVPVAVALERESFAPCCRRRSTSTTTWTRASPCPFILRRRPPAGTRGRPSAGSSTRPSPTTESVTRATGGARP